MNKMKRESSLKIKYDKKLKTSLELEKVGTETPKREKIKLKKNNSTKKKQRKDFKEALIQKSNAINLLKEPTVQLSKFSERNNYILSPNKPKDIIKKLMVKKIDKKKFIERIKFVKSKLYENHGYPYIIHNNNLNNEDTPPLLYDYYKINKILNNSKCRIVARMNEFTLLSNKNEYLIRYSSKKDYYIIIKYLLFYVYAYDRLNYCKKCQKYYDLNEVKLAYKNLVSHNKNSYEEVNTESTNLLIRSFVKKQGNKNNNFRLSKFKSNFKLDKISDSNKSIYSIKNNSRYAKRHSISYGIFNDNKNLFNLSTSKTKKKDSKVYNKKLENINEYYIGLGGELNTNLISCKLKKPNYLFIADIPFTLVPNCLTNLFPIKYDFFNILENYEIKIYKIKLNLYSNNKDKKPQKNYIYNDENNHYADHDKKYNEFIKNISFSGEDFYNKDYGKDPFKKDFLHNANRRLKNDIDILEIENLIALFEETPKKNINKNVIKNSNNDLDKDYSSPSSSSSSSSSSSKLDEKEYIIMKSKFSKTNNKKKIYLNNKKSSSISIKSNNFHSSKSFSSNLKSKESEEINKKNYKNIYNVKLNTEISNSIIKNFKDEKKIKNEINEKISETNVNTIEKKISKKMDLKENENIISLKKMYDEKIIKSNIIRYNNETNKMKINLFKINNNSLNKNKKYKLSLEKNKNKMKLVKSTDKFKNNQNQKVIKSMEYMPIITDKNSHNKLKYSTNPKFLSFDKQNCSSSNSKSRPNSGKFNFKKTYQFAFGRYEERKKFKNKMNLIKDITTEFQRKSLFSKNKSKNSQKEYFPNLDFFISCRMKNGNNMEAEKNEDIYNKNRYLTIGSMDKSNLKEKKYTIKI